MEASKDEQAVFPHAESSKVSSNPTTISEHTPTTSASTLPVKLANGALTPTELNHGSTVSSPCSGSDGPESVVYATPPTQGSEWSLPGFLATPLVASTAETLQEPMCTPLVVCTEENLSVPLSASDHPTLISLASAASSLSGVAVQEGTSREPTSSMVANPNCHTIITCDNAAAINRSFLETVSSTTLLLKQNAGIKVSVAGTTSRSSSKRPTSLPNINDSSGGSTTSTFQDQDPLLSCMSDPVIYSSLSPHHVSGLHDNIVAKVTTPLGGQSLRHSLNTGTTGRTNHFLESNSQAAGSVNGIPLLCPPSPIFAEDPITLAEILGEEWSFLDDHLLPMFVQGNQYCPLASQQAPEQPLFNSCTHPNPVRAPIPPHDQPSTLYNPPQSTDPPYCHPDQPVNYHHGTSWPLITFPGSLSYSSYPYRPAVLGSNAFSLNGYPPLPNAVTNCATQNEPSSQLP